MEAVERVKLEKKTPHYPFLAEIIITANRPKNHEIIVKKCTLQKGYQPSTSPTIMIIYMEFSRTMTLS